jgi:hypothetical protein
MRWTCERPGRWECEAGRVSSMYGQSAGEIVPVWTAISRDGKSYLGQFPTVREAMRAVEEAWAEEVKP